MNLPIFFKMIIAWGVVMVFVLMMGITRGLSWKKILLGMAVATGIVAVGLGGWAVFEWIKGLRA